MGLFVDGCAFGTIVDERATFDSLVAAGKYDWKHEEVTADRFPVRQSTPGNRTLVMLHPGEGIVAGTMIRRAAKRGFEPPTYEDGLRFGSKYPDVQRLFPVVCLHDSLQICNMQAILCLKRDARGRGLSLAWYESIWGADCRFLFVDPRAQD